MPNISRQKAREILRHGEVRGRPLSSRQRRYFGAVAGGETMRSDAIKRRGRRKKKRGRRY